MKSDKDKLGKQIPDDIRRNILEWFYKQNRLGRSSPGIKIVCAGIKQTYGYKAPTVKEHLTYLIDLKYILRDILMIQIKTGATTRDQPKISFRITAKGIEFMEGQSLFSDKERYPGININATGGSSIVLGDGNIINSNFKSIYDELNKYLKAVADSSELNDIAKLEASVNIETIKDQLALNTPDKNIVQKAWETINKICTTATLIDYSMRIAPMLIKILT